MSLVTRCTECATTFRVLPLQLSARGGRVRCGKCATVFDGVANLLTEEAIASLPDEPSPQMGLFDPRDEAHAPDSGAKVGSASIAAGALQIPDPQPLEDLPRYGRADTLASSTPGHPASAAPAEIEDAPVPAFLSSARPGAAYTLVWALLALLAVAALLVQAGLHFRTEIAVLLPPSRIHLETACDMLGCDIRPPRRADLMSIESSDLQADTQRQGVIVLNALLRNRAPFAQQYPDLELTLTDHGDQPLIRRVLKPGEYTQQTGTTLAQGISGGAEESVRIYLDAGGLFATGYQLFLFYPCPPASASAFWQLSYPLRCQDPRNK